MLVLRSVKGIMLTTARYAHRCAEAAQKNVKGWQEDSDEG
jgi:hypothetical protein